MARPYVPPALPTVAHRSDISQQVTRHMQIMATLHSFDTLEQKVAMETLTRCQNYLFERRAKPSEGPSYADFGIAPLRFGTFQVGDLPEYVRTKATLSTTLGAEALKRVASPTEAPAGHPTYQVLRSYLEQFGIEREKGGYVITLLDGDALDEAESLKIAALLTEAATLTPQARAECIRRMALMTA